MSWNRILAGATALCTALIMPAAFGTDGEPDPGFGLDGAAFITPDDVEARELQPYSAVELPDGKLLFAGVRSQFNPAVPFEPQLRAMLARLNADGSVDTGFGNTSIPGVVVLPDIVAGSRMQTIEAMRRLDDGSLIVAGTGQVDVPLKGFVVKLDADGALDGTFGSAGKVLLPLTFLHAVAIDSQGRIVVAGEHVDGGIPHAVIVRLDAGGQPDAGFGTGTDGMVQLDWDGVGGQGGYLDTLAVTDGDGIVAGGSYETYGSGIGADFALARVDADGALDAAFAGTGWRVFHVPGDSSNVNGVERVLLGADGAITFAGHYMDAGTGTQLVLGRLGSDGQEDAAFGDPATPGYQKIELVPDAWDRYASGFARQDDGKLVVAVSYATPAKSDFLALRTTSTGQLDPTFASGGIFQYDLAPDGVYSESGALALDSAQRPILAGRSMLSDASPLVSLAVMRLTRDGAANDRIFADGFEAPPR